MPNQSSPQQGEADPLAELARLIGQTDPFANLGRGGREPPPAPAPSHDDSYDSSEHETQDYDTSAYDTSDHATSDDDAPPEFDVKPSRPSWMQRVAQREAPPSYEEPVQATKSYSEPSSREPSFDDAYPAAPQDPRQDPRHDPRLVPSQHDAAYLQPHDPAYDQPVDPARYDDALYGVAEHEQDPNYDPHAVYPEDAYGQQGYDEEMAERAKPRRGGMMTVAVVVALAFVGTAGAYTYRTWNGSPRSGEAPIIKADPGPNKVVPPTQSADASSKPIQDRIATGPGSEKIVSREEQPVDVNTAKAGPRVVFPPLTQNPNPNPGGGAAPVIPATRQPVAGGATSGNLNGDEPRRVRTLSIRPDQAETAPTAAAPAGRQPAAAAPAPRAAAPATTATTAPPANAPMSLSPQGAAPTRTASNPPAAAASSVQASTGGYVVQISSQRSEADAQSSYRALQGKFPSVLGSRPPLIKRADLGDKGIYYRAMVGPFGTPDEATQFCGSLKTAGGQCVVQRN